MSASVTNKARVLGAVRKAAARVETTRAAESSARERLATAIRAAILADLRVQEIGEAAGMSGARVSQIFHETKEKP